MIKLFNLTLDGTLIGSTTPGQRGPGSNDVEGKLQILQTHPTGLGINGHEYQGEN